MVVLQLGVGIKPFTITNLQIEFYFQLIEKKKSSQFFDSDVAPRQVGSTGCASCPPSSFSEKMSGYCRLGL